MAPLNETLITAGEADAALPVKMKNIIATRNAIE